MNKTFLILVAAAVLAFQCAEGQFSFSLPGNWGNGKRAFSFALPGKWGNVKRNGKVECGDLDPETVLSLYRTIQEEALRINHCFGETAKRVKDENQAAWRVETEGKH